MKKVVWLFITLSIVLTSAHANAWFETGELMTPEIGLDAARYDGFDYISAHNWYRDNRHKSRYIRELKFDEACYWIEWDLDREVDKDSDAEDLMSDRCRELHNSANEMVLRAATNYNGRNIIDRACIATTAAELDDLVKISQGGYGLISGEATYEEDAYQVKDDEGHWRNRQVIHYSEADWAYARLCATGFEKWRYTNKVLNDERSGLPVRPYQIRCGNNPNARDSQTDCGEALPLNESICLSTNGLTGDCTNLVNHIERIVYKVDPRDGKWYKYVRKVENGRYTSHMAQVAVVDIEKEFPRFPQRSWMSGWNFGPIQKQIILDGAIARNTNYNQKTTSVDKLITGYKATTTNDMISGFYPVYTAYKLDILNKSMGIKESINPNSIRMYTINYSVATDVAPQEAQLVTGPEVTVAPAAPAEETTAQWIDDAEQSDEGSTTDGEQNDGCNIRQPVNCANNMIWSDTDCKCIFDTGRNVAEQQTETETETETKTEIATETDSDLPTQTTDNNPPDNETDDSVKENATAKGTVSGGCSLTGATNGNPLAGLFLLTISLGLLARRRFANF